MRGGAASGFASRAWRPGGGLVAAFVLHAAPASAQSAPAGSTQPYHASDHGWVGGRLWLQVPYSRIHVGATTGSLGFTLVGGSASITLAEWVEIEGGASWGGSPGISPEADVVARAGVTLPLYRGRKQGGAGITVQPPVFMGYRRLSWSEGCDSCEAGEFHLVSWDVGVGLTYWFAPHFGLGFRALADVGVVASGSTHGLYEAEQDRAGAVVGGYTASVGLAF